MIKLKLLKGEKDQSEIVFIQEEGKEPKKLIFDVIKDYSTLLLSRLASGENFDVSIETDDVSLDVYKQILEKIFKSIKEDEELLDLYKETKTANDEGNKTDCDTLVGE